MMGTHLFTWSMYATSPRASRFISATRPHTSNSESWQLCTCVSFDRSILKMLSGASVFSLRWDSSLSVSTWISVRSTVSWSTTGSLLCSSSSCPMFPTLAAPRAASSARTLRRRASSCSICRRSEVSTKVLALHMCGINAHRTPRYTATSTLPFSSGLHRHNNTWICSRERHTWSASRRACLMTHNFSLASCPSPSCRNLRTRWVRSDWTSVSTSALSSDSVRRALSRSVMSSMWTKPSSSSGSICMSRFTSCGLRRSGNDWMHSRQKRRLRPTSTCSWPFAPPACAALGLMMDSIVGDWCTTEERRESAWGPPGTFMAVFRFRGAEGCWMQ
mmetsp:Transcript_34042/g.68742  ORF Transcript_34042/g.68742 Transcript_34042/m.68742 type:complete len:332 (-) Transcript_34042:1119-2114(-)